MLKVGVLALQGDFAEHIAMLERLGVEAPEVRLPQDLEAVDGLIIPGGESTTITRLMDTYGMTEPLTAAAKAGKPVWGTCAGLILLARKILGRDQSSLNLLDVDIQRNAYGRQVDSFEEDLPVPAVGDKPFPAVFIRAPVISRVGPGVQVLAFSVVGGPVAVRQGNVLGVSFHPELTADSRLHAYFVGLVAARLSERHVTAN